MDALLGKKYYFEIIVVLFKINVLPNISLFCNIPLGIVVYVVAIGSSRGRRFDSRSGQRTKNLFC